MFSNENFKIAVRSEGEAWYQWDHQSYYFYPKGNSSLFAYKASVTQLLVTIYSNYLRALKESILLYLEKYNSHQN